MLTSQLVEQGTESLAQDRSAKLEQQLCEFCHQKHMGQKPGHQQELVIRMLTQVLCQKLCGSEIRQQNGFKKILAGYPHL